MSAGELRLALWSTLPERHRDEVCRQVRRRCEAFIAAAGVERSERGAASASLTSEVIAHLLRAVSLRWDEESMHHPGETAAAGGARPAPSAMPAAPGPWADAGAIHAEDAARDGRVLWLLDEIGNRRALAHRFEDMRRRERGGKWDGASYPFVQVEERVLQRLAGHLEPADDPREICDAQQAWRGLVAMVERQLGPQDDVFALVRLLAQDADIQDAFGAQWPIARIVEGLHRCHGGAPWSEDRVENAKRRLTRWISRLRREHGLDAVDLRALLVRYAREIERRSPRRPGDAMADDHG
jgi:hypothetical protein